MPDVGTMHSSASTVPAEATLESGGVRVERSREPAPDPAPAQQQLAGAQEELERLRARVAELERALAEARRQPPADGTPAGSLASVAGGAPAPDPDDAALLARLAAEAAATGSRRTLLDYLRARRL